jgi:hypothetical protein
LTGASIGDLDRLRAARIPAAHVGHDNDRAESGNLDITVLSSMNIASSKAPETARILPRDRFSGPIRFCFRADVE